MSSIFTLGFSKRKPYEIITFGFGGLVNSTKILRISACIKTRLEISAKR